MDNVIVQIPRSVENTQLPDPSLLNYYKDLENRSIWLENEISSDETLDIIKSIVSWNREDKANNEENPAPIKIFFFCPGGDLDVSNALIDAIKMSKTPVWGINMGQCASGAAFTFISCHKRFMLPRSYFLFHQGSGSFSGSYSEVCYQIQEYQDQIDNLIKFMVENTKYTQEEVEENIGGEWYIHADQAITHGVCDKIIDNIYEVL